MVLNKMRGRKVNSKSINRLIGNSMALLESTKKVFIVDAVTSSGQQVELGCYSKFPALWPLQCIPVLTGSIGNVHHLECCFAFDLFLSLQNTATASSIAAPCPLNLSKLSWNHNSAAKKGAAFLSCLFPTKQGSIGCVESRKKNN